jgi:hypothetical protein
MSEKHKGNPSHTQEKGKKKPHLETSSYRSTNYVCSHFISICISNPTTTHNSYICPTKDQISSLTAQVMKLARITKFLNPLLL